MYIEIDKYCWNSLRKGRMQGFESDVQEAFIVFKNYMLNPEEITTKEFLRITNISQFQFILKCRAEEEDEEEFAQLLYQILIDNYFMSKNQPKQIFALYALYYLYSQQEKKRKINIDNNFLDEFLFFIKKNSSKADREWMMVGKKLFQTCVSVGLKTGIKTYLIKPNGQPARKGRYSNTQSKRLQNKEQKQQEKKEQYQFLQTFKEQFFNLEGNLQAYSKGKEKFNREVSNSDNKLVYSDKNLGIRLMKKFNQYEKLLSEKHSQHKQTI